MSCTYKENKVAFILTNFIILLIGLILYILSANELIPRYKAGFFCDDPKLLYPFTGDTVTTTTAICIVIIIPPIMIFISEAMLYFCEYEAFQRKDFLKCMKIAFVWCIQYFINLAFANIIMHIFKSTCGEPRPDFMDTCKPDVCENSTLHIFHQKYKCTNPDDSIAENSTKSFLSGHATNSVYCAAFMFWYFQRRIYPYCPRLVTLVLQILFIMFAIVCSMTRITDHRHHWWDVACGIILGVLCAVFAIRISCNDFMVKTFSSSQMLFTNKKNCVTNEEVIEIK